MTRQQVKQANSEALALAIYEEMKSTGDFISFIHDYMYDNDYQVVRNAFWCLTKADREELAQLQPLLNELIDLALAAVNPSVRRLSLCVIERLELKEEELRTDFLDYCLDRMVSLDELPGTQSVCMKLAYRMCRFYPELQGELIRILQSMEMDYYKPAVISVRRRILQGKLK